MILQHSETAINRGENPHQEANKEARNDQDFPKSSSYKTTNACSQRASVEQVLTIAIFVIITGLHGAFITSAAVEIQSEILWTLVGFTYAILGLIIYDYLFLSCSDPVDDMLLNSRN